MTVKQLLNTIDSRELSEWVAYDTIEPIGSIRTDLAGGIISSTIANCHRGKNQEAFKATDFMPLYKNDDDTEEGDANMVAAKFEAFAMMNSAVKVVDHDIDVEGGE